MGQRIRAFGSYGEPHEDNRCLIFKEERRGDIFEYHNLPPVVAEKVRIFSRITEDELVVERVTKQCRHCKRTNFELRRPQKNQVVYDKQEVDRVNETLRCR